MLRMKKKKKVNEAEEEEEEEEIENDDNNSNNTALNLNAEQSLSQLKIKVNNKNNNKKNTIIDHMSVINRLGAALQLLSSAEMRADSEWICNSGVCVQLMNDFSLLNQQIIDGDPVIDFDVYSFIVCKYFGGEECNQRECPSSGARDRNGDGNGNDNNETELLMRLRLRQMDCIHCTLLHGYQSGYKLYGNEREIVNKRMLLRMMDDSDDDDDDGKEDNENQNNNNNSNNNTNFAYDSQLDCIRSLLSVRDRDGGSGGLRSQSEEQHMQSKFVTHVNEEAQNVILVEQQQQQPHQQQEEQLEQPQQPQQKQQPPEIFYAFGYKFYYWEWFRNNEEIDVHYNGGRDAYGVWYVFKKYRTFKDELLNANVALEAVDNQIGIAKQWGQTEYMRKMRHTGASQYFLEGYYRVIQYSHMMCVSVSLFCLRRKSKYDCN